MFRVYKHESHQGTVIEFSLNSKLKKILVLRSEYRRILSFGTYFKKVFTVPLDIKVRNIHIHPTSSTSSESSEIRHIPNSILEKDFSDIKHNMQFYNSEFLKFSTYTDTYGTVGVPGVQYCQSITLPGTELHATLPDLSILLRIYSCADLIDSFDSVLPNNTMLFGNRNPLGFWKFSENFASTYFAWTCNEALSEGIMNYCIDNKGYLGMTVKFYRGAVIPVIDLTDIQ